MNIKTENDKSLIIDALEGDESIFLRDDFKGITGEEVRSAVRAIVNNPSLNESQKNYFLKNSWRILYSSRPPSIEEFLTPEWIGPTANTIFPHIRKILTEFFNPFSDKRHLILATGIGTGKSFATAIASLYILTNVILMKNAKQFFNLSQAASIVGLFVSFSMKKAKQLLAAPFHQILTSSPKFVRVKMQERIEPKQKEIGYDKIVWSSASKMEGIAEFSNDVHLLLASDPANLLGLNLLFCAMSELSFFIDRGVNPEEIWRIYNDAKGRIFSRFSNRYFATTIMDSSPNDIDLPIDKYVFTGEAYKDPLNYIVTGPHWDYLPKKYEIWNKTKETFPIFRGNSMKLPKILSEDELPNYSPEDIIQVPIDVKSLFVNDIQKSTKDYAGWPAGGNNKLIEEPAIIEEMFVDNLINIETYIFAPADKSPERLIWDQIKDIFFVLIDKKYYFYRYSNLPRYLHFDLSETGDLTAVSACHLECLRGENIVVVDFTIVISPGKGRINLDAIYEFVLDLTREGHLNIAKVTGDRYQSSALIQRLKRDGYESENVSVDMDTAPYYMLASFIKTKRIKVGRNLILRGNLRSLIETKTEKGKKKIDHMLGPVSYDLSNINWNTSILGVNGKDCSDAVCGAFFTCMNESQGVPSAVWDEATERTVGNKRLGKELMLNKIKNVYGLNVMKVSG